MDISVIFPIIYCVVVLVSLILYIAAFAGHKYIGFIYYRKHPDAKQEAVKQKMSPRRIAFAMIASVLIIADFVTLAVLNYNFYYWIKIYVTMAFLVIWVSVLCTKDFFGCIGDIIRRFSGLMFFLFTVSSVATFFLFIQSIPAVEEKETVEIADLRAIDQEKKVFVIVEGGGTPYYYYNYYKENDISGERVSSVDAKVYLQYSFYDFATPHVMECYQTPILKYKVYGKEQEKVGEKKLTLVEIHAPRKFVLELDTQRKT